MRYAGSDKLDCLIQLAYLHCGTKDAALLDEVDGTEVAIPKRLDRRIRRLIDKKSRGQAFTTTKRVLGRIAIAAMLIMSIMFALLFSVSGIREAIWRAIVEWHDNYLTIHYEEDTGDSQTTEESTPITTKSNSSDETPPEHSEDTSLESQSPVTPPTKIEEVRKPSYVLDGVVEDVLESKACVSIDYYSGNDLLYSFSQFVLEKDKKYVDNENATVQEISVNGRLASLLTYENNPDRYIFWNDGEYVYILFSSAIDVEQMIDIAESVKAN